MLTKLRSLPCSLYRCALRPACFVVRSASSSPTVAPLGLDGVLLIGVRPERSGNQNFRRHVQLALFETDRSSFSHQTVISRGPPGRHRHDHVGEGRPRVVQIVLRRAARDDPDANGRTPAARRRAPPRAARRAGSRTAARESAGAAPPRSCSAARRSPSRVRRARPARRSTRADTSPRRARGWRASTAGPRVNGGCAVSTSAVQKFSVRYFSAPSGNTVTTTPRRAGARHVQRRRQRRARRNAGQQPFLARQPPHHVVRLLGAHAQVLVGERRVVNPRHDRRLHVLQPLEPVERRVGLERNQPDRRVELAQPPPGADERAARAEAGDEVRQPPARLLDDLRRRSCRSARASSRRCCTDPDRNIVRDPRRTSAAPRESRRRCPRADSVSTSSAPKRAQNQLALGARVVRHAERHA